MTASDPAAAAAQRAWGTPAYFATHDPAEVMAQAAREALAPLRKVINRFDALHLVAPEYTTFHAQEVEQLVDELRTLIYSEQELS